MPAEHRQRRGRIVPRRNAGIRRGVRVVDLSKLRERRFGARLHCWIARAVRLRAGFRIRHRRLHDDNGIAQQGLCTIFAARRPGPISDAGNEQQRDDARCEAERAAVLLQTHGGVADRVRQFVFLETVTL
jgi:hypothetical protein